MSICVLRSPQWTVNERGLQTQAQFLGLQVRAISGPEDETGADPAIHIAATCQSIEAFLTQPSGREWLSRRLAAKGSSLFHTGITASEQHLATIAELVPGVVQSVTRVPDASAYEIAQDPWEGMRPFAGLRFGPVDPDIDGTLMLTPGLTDVTELVTVSSRACYVKVERDAASYFLLACGRVLDIDGPVR